MIEKLEFYHGAAIVRVIEDPRCTAIKKNEAGYVVNGDHLLILKYTTKSNSPWRFTISQDDIERFESDAKVFAATTLGLVCGGDGICGISWSTAHQLIGTSAGWLSVKRLFNRCYGVAGSLQRLKRKVPLNHWPALIFEEDNNG